MIPRRCTRCLFVAYTSDEQDAHRHEERRREVRIEADVYTPERREQLREMTSAIGRPR